MVGIERGCASNLAPDWFQENARRYCSSNVGENDAEAKHGCIAIRIPNAKDQRRCSERLSNDCVDLRPPSSGCVWKEKRLALNEEICDGCLGQGQARYDFTACRTIS